MPITTLAASLLGLLFIYLAMNVSKHRGRAKVSIGDGGDEQLQYAIRAHANLCEHAPIGLILIGLLEYREFNGIAVMVLGAMLVLGRYMHGLTLGKFEGRNPFRFWGTILTWLSILAASIAGLLSYFAVL